MIPRYVRIHTDNYRLQALNRGTMYIYTYGVEQFEGV